MSKSVRRHSRLLIAVFALAVLAAVPMVSLANHSWNNYHWAATNIPFTLLVGDNVESKWDAYLDEAISDWSASSVLNLTKVAGGTTGRQCKPTLGRIEACNARYGNNGWLGIAQIWLSGGHIAQAITKLNDTYFDTATYNKPEWRRLVTCQEIAHDFGLDHQDENFNNANLGSCMDYTNNPLGPPSNEHPNAHDFEQLLTIYGHLDSTGTLGAVLPSSLPPGLRNLVLESPQQWGPVTKAISNGGGLVTYHEQDFGGGNKIITHVFWALDAEGRGRGE